MDQTSSIKPPKEAYEYQPSPTDIKSKVGKQIVRRIFDCELDEDDNKALDSFLAETGPRDNPIWTRPQMLRFLQANGFKPQPTTASMLLYEEWRKTLPIPFDAEVEQFLNSGVIYIQGRDKSYRPIIVLNAARVNFNDMSLEIYLKGLTYFLEIVLNEMMIPGRVENWIILMDLDGKGITGLYVNALKQVMSYLQNNYRSRLYRLYILNSTMMINMTWNVVRPFLEENTQQKINFVKGADPLAQLFETTNRTQVEVRFGGLYPNRTQYWPPVVDNQC